MTPAQKLATDYMSYAKGCARVFCRKLPKTSVEKDEIVSDAYVGLVRASNAYDPSRGQFCIFATKWIFGAMKDGIRQRNKLAFAGIYSASLDTCLDVIHSGITRQFPGLTGGTMASLAEELENALADEKAVDPADAAAQSEGVETIRDGIASRYGRPADPALSVGGVAERFGIGHSAASKRLKLARQILQAIHEDAKNPCPN